MGIRSTLRDARDLLRHARPREIVRALVPGLQRPEILNDGGAGAGPPPLAELAALRRRLQADAFTEDGKVDYRRLAGTPLYAELVATSRRLAGARLELDDDAARTAFWINLYNILTVHGVVALGIRASVMEVPSFFARVAYRVGGEVLTLDMIENGVLRRNRPPPDAVRRLFASGDPRIALAPSRLDPRVHAALVCGARSCPPIRFYEPDRLDAQLTVASEGLVAGHVEVDEAARRIALSAIFCWYAADFGGAAGLRDFLLAHARGAQRDALVRGFAQGWRRDALRHDWRLNHGP